MPQDLDRLVMIAKKTFVDAFEQDNNPTDFQEYVEIAFSKVQLKKELENPRSVFYFVFDTEVMVGYFKLNEGYAQTDLKLTESIELERIYVLQEFQGKKIGAGILQEALKIASTKKKEFIWLGVWQKNKAAIRFYEKYGFEKFESHPYYIGDDRQIDWLMRFSF